MTSLQVRFDAGTNEGNNDGPIENASLGFTTDFWGGFFLVSNLETFIKDGEKDG